jgi:cell division protein FtsQ
MSTRASQQAVYLNTRPFTALNGQTVRRAIFILVSVLFLSWGITELRKPDTLPIKTIHALGSFSKVDETMLRNVIAESLDGGYFAVNVSAIKHAVESLPWVHSASVSRIWPDTISINVVEEKTTAVWAKGGLVNHQGALILPLRESYPKGLPVFNGPLGMERNMTEFYKTAKQIIEPLGIEITGLNLDTRGAYVIGLSNDIDLLLGRENIQNRLERFARVYKKVLVKRSAEIARIDMRYSNGLAVGWRNLNKG